MCLKPAPDYLAGYPAESAARVRTLVAPDRPAALLLRKYLQAHEVRSDSALHDCVQALKSEYLRNAAQPNKVAFDSKLHAIRNVLGIHTSIARAGSKLKAKREIRIASVFRAMPPDFLRMIVVHELAHLKEHDKAFHQLCRRTEPDYPPLEFDLRACLSYREATGRPLWPAKTPATVRHQGTWAETPCASGRDRPGSMPGSAPAVEPAPRAGALALVGGGPGSRHQQVSPRTFQQGPVRQDCGTHLFRREPDRRAFTPGRVAGQLLPDGEQPIRGFGLSLVAHSAHEPQRFRRQRKAPRVLDHQTVRGKAQKRRDEVNVERNRAVQQVRRSHDLREIRRPPLGSKCGGHQEEYIHIVDRVHGMTFE